MVNILYIVVSKIALEANQQGLVLVCFYIINFLSTSLAPTEYLQWMNWLGKKKAFSSSWFVKCWALFIPVLRATTLNLHIISLTPVFYPVILYLILVQHLFPEMLVTPYSGWGALCGKPWHPALHWLNGAYEKERDTDKSLFCSSVLANGIFLYSFLWFWEITKGFLKETLHACDTITWIWYIDIYW